MFVAEIFLLFALFLETGTGFIGSLACTTIAAAQHYAFLATFSWTNVMSLDVCRMLTFPMSSHRKTRFIYYSVYAWSCPLILVVTAIVAEVTQLNVQPSYADGTCWLSSTYGLLAYFLGPVFVMLAANIILYVISVASIIRSARQTKMVNPNLKERLLLALKLIIVTGLPWILAIFRAFFNSVALSYIFDITIGLQGTFLTICYVFSKTVINLFKTSGGLKRSGKSTRTSGYSVSNRISSHSLSAKYSRPTSRTLSASKQSRSKDGSHTSIPSTTADNEIRPQSNIE